MGCELVVLEEGNDVISLTRKKNGNYGSSNESKFEKMNEPKDGCVTANGFTLRTYQDRHIAQNWGK